MARRRQQPALEALLDGLVAAVGEDPGCKSELDVAINRTARLWREGKDVDEALADLDREDAAEYCIATVAMLLAALWFLLAGPLDLLDELEDRRKSP